MRFINVGQDWDPATGTSEQVRWCATLPTSQERVPHTHCPLLAFAFCLQVCDSWYAEADNSELWISAVAYCCGPQGAAIRDTLPTYPSSFPPL
jgi:hypothetical protein